MAPVASTPFASCVHIGCLPLEIIEEILIFATAMGSPTAVSAFAQTCRHFYNSVYQPRHNHLWRQMFLTVFDDSRPAMEIVKYGRAAISVSTVSSAESSRVAGKQKEMRDPPSSDDFPWEGHYKRRVWAGNFIARYASDDSTHPSSDDLCSALECLLDVVQTSTPMPSSSFDNLPPPTHTHPLFPPLSVASTSRPKLFPKSRNITWLSSVLSAGFPLALTSRLSLFTDDGGFRLPAEPRAEDQLFYRLLSYTGLLQPISGCSTCVPNTLLSAALEVPQNAAEAETGDESDDSSYSPESDARSQSESHSDSEGASSDEDESSASAAELEEEALAEENEFRGGSDGARRLARIRVYDMRYLQSDRLYGPFIVAPPRPSSSAGSSGRSSHGSPTTHSARRDLASAGTSAEIDDALDEDDAIDSDYVDSDAESVGSGSGSVSGAGQPRIARSRILFDWTWLSAARQIVEGNLRDLLLGRHQNVLRALLNLEGLRPCSAPGFRDGMRGGADGMQAAKEGEGWDWAGVEGQWRCVG